MALKGGEIETWKDGMTHTETKTKSERETDIKNNGWKRKVNVYHSAMLGVHGNPCLPRTLKIPEREYQRPYQPPATDDIVQKRYLLPRYVKF
jgi:hypothetical protein